MTKFFITQNDKLFSHYPTLVIRKRIIGRIGIRKASYQLLFDKALSSEEILADLNKRVKEIVKVCDKLNKDE
jgi:hypothetical protein